MKIFNCDIFSLADRADAICITINGIIKADGRAVMGAGNALQAKKLYPDIDLRLADHLNNHGNVPGIINLKPCIVSFPTKNHWRDKSSLFLIEQSAQLLALMIKERHWQKVALPKPGCNNGHLKWEEVEPIIEKYLPSVFVCEQCGSSCSNIV
jgi:hypothetical protein